MKFPYKGIFAFCSAVCLFAVSMPISTVAASAETSPRKAVQADCVSDFADADSEDGYLPLQGAAIAFENSDGNSRCMAVQQKRILYRNPMICGSRVLSLL